MYDQYVVTGSEVDDPLEQLPRRSLSRRHVGVVDKHHLHAFQPGALDRFKVRIEIRLLVECVSDHLSARQTHGRRVGRVAGIGHQHLVARIQERHADVHDALFRADQRQHLRVVVQFGAVPLPIPVGKGLAQNGFALVGHVFVHVGALCFLRESFDNRGVGRQVGTAHGQFDDLTARGRFDFGYLAKTAREIVLPDAVQTVRPGNVDCFCHDRFLFVDPLLLQR